MKKVKVAIIDYNSGNLFSISQACNFIGMETIISSDKNEILSADCAILPGVGAFSTAMNYLKKTRLIDTIYNFIETKKYFLGICLGAQLLLNESSEFESTPGLSLIDGKNQKIDSLSRNKTIRVPHIGWNQVNITRKNSHTLLSECDNKNFYFVHSYAMNTDNLQNTIATTKYSDTKFATIIAKENILGVQFHPERSGETGLNLLKEFNNKILSEL